MRWMRLVGLLVWLGLFLMMVVRLDAGGVVCGECGVGGDGGRIDIRPWLPVGWVVCRSVWDAMVGGRVVSDPTLLDYCGIYFDEWSVMG